VKEEKINTFYPGVAGWCGGGVVVVPPGERHEKKNIYKRMIPFFFYPLPSVPSFVSLLGAGLFLDREGKKKLGKRRALRAKSIQLIYSGRHDDQLWSLAVFVLYILERCTRCPDSNDTPDNVT